MLTLQLERLRGAVMFLQSQDLNAGLLTPLQFSPCGLTEFTEELPSSWVELLLFSAWSSSLPICLFGSHVSFRAQLK